MNIINQELLNSNLEKLARLDNLLFTQIFNHLKSGKYQFQIIRCKNNGYTYYIEQNNEKKFIHSQYDAVKESERFIGQFEFKNTDLIIAIYPGLAYHLNYLFKNTNVKILVITRNIDELIALLQIVELPNTNNYAFIYYQSENEIASKFEKVFDILFHNNVKYLILPTISKIYGDEIKKILEICGACLDNAVGQALTISQFGEIFHNNVINNFRYLCSAPGINTLKNKFADMPAIIVSAGPSLDENIDELKKHKDKFIIIAVDTVYKKLLKSEIIPHFTISIDPQNKSYYHFYDATLHNFFVTCMIASIKVVESIANKSFFFVSDYPLSLFFENLTEKKGNLSTGGGSVATVALQFADYIGAKYIALIGQDLSFPYLKTHCAQTMYDNNIYAALNKFRTIETENLQIIGNKISVKGIKQKEVYTTHQLYEYWRWIRKYVNSSNPKKYFNCTYNGAYIDGIEHLELDEFVSRQDLQKINVKLDELQKIIKNHKPINYLNIIAELENQLLRLKEIFKIN
ncbi:MAG TPA: DUF115 domain-containing protein, partial [bacterium]|nr:DUF115 domain-containing protein [bacterium]